MAIHIFVICLVVLGLQNIISITIHKKRFSKQVDELQKQLDEKKEESELVMREMLSNITHDLKTPLTAIRGYAQGILDGVAATPDRMNKYISTIRNKADDMANLVNELSLSPSSIGISPLPTPHRHLFQQMCVRSSTAFYSGFNLDMGRSPGFGSMSADLAPY